MSEKYDCDSRFALGDPSRREEHVACESAAVVVHFSASPGHLGDCQWSHIATRTGTFGTGTDTAISADNALCGRSKLMAAAVVPGLFLKICRPASHCLVSIGVQDDAEHVQHAPLTIFVCCHRSAARPPPQRPQERGAQRWGSQQFIDRDRGLPRCL